MEIGMRNNRKLDPPDFGKIDNMPTTRRERQNAIWEIIVRGEERHGGYNLQSLISKLSVSWGMKRKTVAGYFESMQRAGFIYVDRALKVRLLKK